MKRAFLIFLALVTALSVSANPLVLLSGSPPSVGGTTYTLQDDYGSSPGALDGAFTHIGSAANRLHVASYFVAGTEGGSAPYSATKVGVNIKKFGNPTWNFVISLRTNSSNLPNGTVIASTASTAASTISTTAAWVELTITGGTLTNGTVYWLSIDCDGSDASNYLDWQHTTDVPSDNFVRTYTTSSSTGTSGWAGLDNTMRSLRVYKSP